MLIKNIVLQIRVAKSVCRRLYRYEYQEADNLTLMIIRVA